MRTRNGTRVAKKSRFSVFKSLIVSKSKCSNYTSFVLTFKKSCVIFTSDIFLLTMNLFAYVLFHMQILAYNRLRALANYPASEKRDYNFNCSIAPHFNISKAKILKS